MQHALLFHRHSSHQSRFTPFPSFNSSVTAPVPCVCACEMLVHVSLCVWASKSDLQDTRIIYTIIQHWLLIWRDDIFFLMPKVYCGEHWDCLCGLAEIGFSVIFSVIIVLYDYFRISVYKYDEWINNRELWKEWHPLITTGPPSLRHIFVPNL